MRYGWWTAHSLTTCEVFPGWGLVIIMYRADRRKPLQIQRMRDSARLPILHHDTRAGLLRLVIGQLSGDVAALFLLGALKYWKFVHSVFFNRRTATALYDGATNQSGVLAVR